MVTAPDTPRRFQLPARIRANATAAEALPSRLLLADRISELPGVEAVECDGDILPRRINIYVRDATAGRTGRNPERGLLCRLSANGISIFGLDDWAKHQVIMRGWGKLLQDRVLVFLPRNESELDICWRILRQAYDSVFHRSAGLPGNGYPVAQRLPGFSRTTLQ